MDEKSGSFCFASASFAPNPPNPPFAPLAAGAAAALASLAPSLPGSRSAGIMSGTTVSDGSSAGSAARAASAAEAMAFRVTSVTLESYPVLLFIFTFALSSSVIPAEDAQAARDNGLSRTATTRRGVSSLHAGHSTSG